MGGERQLVMTERHKRLHAIAKAFEPFRDAAPLPAQLREAVLENSAYRRTLYTPIDGAPESRVQSVAMSIRAGASVDWEVHPTTTQTFIVMQGEGTLYRGQPHDATPLQRKDATSVRVRAGDVWIIEPGTWHDVEAISTLKLLTLYTPPAHLRGTVDERP